MRIGSNHFNAADAAAASFCIGTSICNCGCNNLQQKHPILFHRTTNTSGQISHQIAAVCHQVIYLNKSSHSQGSHQATKLKFPDIPDRFLKIPDDANSVYHFSGRLHLPDPLPSTFNASISSFRHIFSTYN